MNDVWVIMTPFKHGVAAVLVVRNNQSLKGPIVVTHCQNEADVKIQMDIDSHI